MSWLAGGQGPWRALVLVLFRPAPAAEAAGYEPPADTPVLSLEPLGEEQMHAMVRSLLGDVAPAVASMVAEHAEGNPFYIEELARHLQDAAGAPAASGRGELEVLEDLPGSIESLIATRLARLTEAARPVAELAAVLGRSFRLAVIESTGLAPAAREGIAELCGRELLFDVDGHGAEYIFKHALTRDVAYASVLRSRRRVLHRAAAMALEAAGASDAVLGHHWELAGAPAEARRRFLAAARQATEVYAHEEAERLYRASLALHRRTSAETVAAWRELGERVLHKRGRPADALEAFRRARDGARRLRDRVEESEALRLTGVTLWDTGRTRDAEARLESALAIAGRRTGPAGRALGSLAGLLHELGRMDEARAAYDRALQLHRAAGNRGLMASLLNNLAILHKEQGRRALARRLYARALRLHEAAAQRKSMAAVKNNLAVMHQEEGDVAGALARYEEALAIYREVGDRRSEGIVLGNIGQVMLDQQRLEEAERAVRQALAIAREVGNRDGEGIVLTLLGGIHEIAGRAQEAREVYEQALRADESTGDRRARGMVLRLLARLARLRGDLDEAWRLATASIGDLEALGEKRELARSLVEAGMVAAARGEGVGEALARARALRQQIGDGDGGALAFEMSELERVAVVSGGRVVAAARPIP